MIKFISDYSALGIGFIFRECENCGKIRITLSKKVDEKDNLGRQGYFIAHTCVDKELFENEDLLLAELANCLEDMFKTNGDDLKFM